MTEPTEPFHRTLGRLTSRWPVIIFFGALSLLIFGELIWFKLT